MTYTLLEMMEGKWIKGYVFKREEYSNTFIKDLAFLLNELHQYPHSKKYKPLEMSKIVQNFELLLSHEDKVIRTFIEDTISESQEIYGDYRPIQILNPVFEEGFEYSVFLDLKRMDKDLIINDVGLLLFCPKEKLNLKHLEEVIRTYPNWENSRTYSLYDV